MAVHAPVISDGATLWVDMAVGTCSATNYSAIHSAIYSAVSGILGLPKMTHITANDLKTRGIAAIEAALAEGRADIAEGRFVAESPAAHLARVRAINAAGTVEGIEKVAKARARQPPTNSPRKAVKRRVV
jgi:hypothetical protein